MEENYLIDINIEKKYELQQSDAIHRYEIIGNKTFDAKVGEVHYDIALVFTENDDWYHGSAVATFNAKNLPEGPIWIDVKATKIFQMKCNGVKTRNMVFDNRRVFLPNIVLGKNVVEIHYENNYSNDGTGLHKYIDPEDKLTYLYSQFEAFNAHKCFPCFD